MTNEAKSPNDKKVYDLEERTAIFGENVIDFVRTPIFKTHSTNHKLINQRPRRK